VVEVLVIIKEVVVVQEVIETHILQNLLVEEEVVKQV
jgi:hypothetical protein